MKISTRTRYGTRLMIELGLYFSQGPVFMKDIARKEDISEKYLSQIIIALKNAGLVNSFRGARGGYLLTRPPARITMREIFEVLEGGVELVNCTTKPAECNRAAICVTRHLWKDLGGVITDKLERVTLNDLVKQCRRQQEESVMYTI